MPTFQTQNINMYYEVKGAGPPLLLISGLASDSQSWLPVLNELSRHHRVIVPDNRGVGRTTPQEAPVGVEELAADCERLLRHLGITSAAVVGHSMGGMVALELAHRDPSLVSHLVLAGTAPQVSVRNRIMLRDWVHYLENGMDPALWFRIIFYWIFTPGFFEDDVMVEGAVSLAIEYPFPQSPVAFRNQAEALARYKCRKDLDKLDIPTLVVCGEQDILIPLDDSRALLAIPGSRLDIIPGAAHPSTWSSHGRSTHCCLSSWRRVRP